MRIKRIEIIGFKSFCDRSIININTPITSVVGPNGCGKSNIVDAIRWCMGEQSAKHLRGKAMDDVIFAGSESRGPAAMAEVSLTFEDVGFSHETMQLSLNQDEHGEAPPKAPSPEDQEDQEDQEPGAANEARAAESTEPSGDAGDADQAPDLPGADPEVGEGDAGEPISAGPSAAQAPGEEAALPGAAPHIALVSPESDPGNHHQPGSDGDSDDMLLGEEPQSASQEVAEFLDDKPVAFDFARYSEVTITRRLFRDGSSHYLINKTPCRLRDVTDFFLGTGIGTKAYSIIEQGRIGMIVSARPQDRRTIIEEAAGITKFKTKKKAAERKLEQTRQNLLRVSDIVDELQKRMGALKRQAQKAERYRSYKSEVRDIELWKAAHKYLEMIAEHKVAASTLSTCKTGLEDARVEFDARESKMIAERAELAVEERRLSALQETVFELENRIKLSESKVEFQTREATALDERAGTAREEIAILMERRAEAQATLEQQRAELEELGQKVQAEEEMLEHQEMSVAEARQMVTNAQSRLDEARKHLETARADLVRAESKKDALERRRDESGRRLARILEETGTLNERSANVDKEARGYERKLAELKQTRLDLGSQVENFEARRTHLEEMVRHYEAEVETLRSDLGRRKSRLHSLVEISAKYEGFAQGTRTVMKAANELSTPGQAIRGLVADVVRAPAHLEVAVEAALGDRLGGVLVDSSDVGAKAIQYLKDKKAGRSAFVACRRQELESGPGPGQDQDQTQASASAAIAMQDGVLGRMIELIELESGFGAVGKSLLGDFVIVDTLARAIELHQRGLFAALTLVSLDGDIVDGRGVLSGGSRQGQGASVLAQKREIRELEELTQRLESQLADATAHHAAAKGELQQVARALESLRKETHQGEIAIMSNEKDMSRCRAELDRLRERKTQLNAEQLELEERIASVDRETAETSALLISAEERIGRYEREQLGMIAGVTDGRARLEELSHLLTEAKIRAAQLGEKRASLHASSLQLQATDRELGERLAKLEASIEESTQRASMLRQACEELGGELTGVRERWRVQAEQLEAGRSAYELRVAELQVSEVAVRELRTRAERLASEVSNLELKLSNLNANRQVLEETMDERYQIVLARVLTDYHLRPQVSEKEDKRLAELKQLLDRMGTDINLTAIDEYAEVSQRYEFLSSQRNDLESAVDQLEKAIAKINKTSRKLFQDTFHAVNRQFQDLFPRLFRGGRAKLMLTMPKGGGQEDKGQEDRAMPEEATGAEVDMLEAGVEILAQPPGKKNSTVDQLSGGEKALTAVALIFSIFLIKPSPFCLLDEVDAPLDDANVDRYNELIREMTDRSQFIIITHNKRTMEIADNLYGVTMQEAGVSKLVSVNLSKIDRVAA